jgi:hypothetical protein
VSDLFQGVYEAGIEVMTGAAIIAGLAVVASGIGGLGWLVFQYVKVCTRNLVRGGADR